MWQYILKKLALHMSWNDTDKGDAMKYLAHKKKEQEQTIKEHLFHTAELADNSPAVLEMQTGVIAPVCFTTSENIFLRFRKRSVQTVTEK